MSSADRRSGGCSVLAAETEVDEFAPYERASGAGETGGLPGFANARQSIVRKRKNAFSRGTAKNAGHLRGKDNMSWEEEEARSRNRSCFTWRSFYMRERTRIIL